MSGPKSEPSSSEVGEVESCDLHRSRCRLIVSWYKSVIIQILLDIMPFQTKPIDTNIAHTRNVQIANKIGNVKLRNNPTSHSNSRIGIPPPNHL